MIEISGHMNKPGKYVNQKEPFLAHMPDDKRSLAIDFHPNHQYPLFSISRSIFPNFPAL